VDVISNVFPYHFIARREMSSAFSCTSDESYQETDAPCEEKSPLFELARVLVRLDHVASRIVNADHSIM